MTIDLMPGDIAVGTAGDEFRTLLGSCVCVILTDPRRTVGAICHIVHTGTPNAANTDNTAYGGPALHALFTRLRNIGINPALCQAYVSGGGNMFPELFNHQHVGASNTRWVLDYLHDHQIEVVDQNLGGSGYRKVSWTVGHREPLVEVVVHQQGVGHAG